MSEKIDISIVIPAFNEAGRLPPFLERVAAYCNRSRRQHEIIVVDDGSSDATSERAASFNGQLPNLSIIRLAQNRGKGFAVKQGFLKARAEICVFLDADGSTECDEIEKNIHYILEENYDIFVGSREMKSEGQIIQGKWYRKLIGVIFNFLVNTVLSLGIKDNMCGFKMFKKKLIQPLFSKVHIEGFSFDIEILYLAHKMGYKIKEGAVSWHYVNGSKINLFFDSIKVFINLLQIRYWHACE